MEKQSEFIADRVSGVEGCVFGLSTLSDAIFWSNRRSSFKFPFYALSIPDGGRKADEWIDEKLYTKVSDIVLAHVLDWGISHFTEVKERIIGEADSLLKKSVQCRENMETLPDEELAERYLDFIQAYVYSYGLGCITFLYESILSERLSQLLRGKYEDATHIIGDLLRSPYKSFMIESEEALDVIRCEKDSSVRETLIESYREKFFFMKANYSQAPELTDACILEMASQSAPSGEQELLQKKCEVILSPEEEAIVSLLRETEGIRDQRKRINLIGSYTMFRFLDEACRRRSVEVSLGKRMFWFELIELLSDADGMVQKLEKRRAVTMAFDGYNRINLEYDAMRPRNIEDHSVMELRGTAAAKGKVTGPVRIVLGSHDFEEFEDGEILVAEMTRPDYVPLLRRASAVLTDEGGLTCHAAIIARELKKPCIVGTKNATRVLHSGDLVEVDADRGVVTILSRGQGIMEG